MPESRLSVSIINLAEVNDYLKKLPERTFDDVKKVFAKAVLRADKQIKENATSKQLKRRTGTLGRSVGNSVTGKNLSNLKASVFTRAFDKEGKPIVYAPIHEFGGTIKAKNAYKRVPGGPYLNIPTKANKTPSGVQRYSAKYVFQSGGTLKQTKTGKWGVFLDGQMMFFLQKSSKIPARLGMRKAADDEIPTILSELKRLIGEED